eukprot:Awhi_evm1s13262
MNTYRQAIESPCTVADCTKKFTTVILMTRHFKSHGEKQLNASTKKYTLMKEHLKSHGEKTIESTEAEGSQKFTT